MKSISVHDLHDTINKQDNNTAIIDVRMPNEFKGQQVKGMRNIPLQDIEKHIDTLKQYDKVILFCQSGTRSQMACDCLMSNGFENVHTVEGGIQEWAKQELPHLLTTKKVMPIMQQVLAIAGSLILIGTLGSLYLHPTFIWLSVAVGVGLSYAGFSGNCMMTKVLAYMPWNE